MLALLLLLGCSSPPVPAAAEIRYGDGSVEQALQRLEARVNAASEDAEEAAAPSDQQLALLEERVAKLELLLAQIQQTGTSSATAVGFDPRATTLSGTTVQSALDELEARVTRVESKVGQDMGQAGPGMFTSSHGRGGAGGGPGGGGPGGGGPGGGGGGGMGGGGGGMQGGGMGGGGGGMGGGGGGMQGGGMGGGR